MGSLNVNRSVSIRFEEPFRSFSSSFLLMAIVILPLVKSTREMSFNAAWDFSVSIQLMYWVGTVRQNELETGRAVS